MGMIKRSLHERMEKSFLVKHEWTYYNYVDNPEVWDYDRPYYKFRLCSITGRLEFQDTHCLGLNPPEYVSSWDAVGRKPRFTKDETGTWCITNMKELE